MSDTDKDDLNADADFDEADPVAEPAPALEPPPESPKKPRRSPTASVAWLALFLALVSAAGMGNLYLGKLRDASEADQSAGAIDGLRARLDAAEQSISANSTYADTLGAANDQLRSMIESLDRDLEDRASLFDSLPPRMAGIERFPKLLG